MRLFTRYFGIYAGRHMQGGYMVNIGMGAHPEACEWRRWRRYLHIRFQ